MRGLAEGKGLADLSRPLLPFLLGGVLGACAPAEDHKLPETEQPLIEWIDEVRGQILRADTGSYVSPTRGEREDFEAALNTLLSGDEIEAMDLFAGIDYELGRLVDPKRRRHYLTLREDEDRGWGSLILRENPKWSSLNIQVPHPLYDRSSLELGRFLFENKEANSILIAGAHRHNITLSEGEIYGDADVAHYRENIFHVISNVMASSPKDLTVQIHGFALENHPDFPSDPPVDVIISDGYEVMKDGGSAASVSWRLENTAFEVRRCNETWQNLCGTDNVQGQDINQDGGSRGSFIHFEVSDDIRNDPDKRSRLVLNMLP